MDFSQSVEYVSTSRASFFLKNTGPNAKQQRQANSAFQTMGLTMVICGKKVLQRPDTSYSYNNRGMVKLCTG